MIPLEYELGRISEMIFEMYDLVKKQVNEAKESLLEADAEKAESIERRELRVNALDINIDRECENVLARYNPLAGDLRFIISVIKIGESLERISDHGYRIARYVKDEYVKKDKELFKNLDIEILFDTVILMLDLSFQALENKDADMAKQVFKHDKIIDKIKKEAPAIIEKSIKGDTKNIKNTLYIFSIIGKLERCGDVIKNIAEELVFYIEAEILRHQKRNQKIKKRFETES